MLDEESMRVAVTELTKLDPDLRRVVETYGNPPLWDREHGFPTLLKIILEQQVSLTSAQATFDKLNATVDTLTPETLLALSDVELRTAGFSRQKTRYSRILAQAIMSGELDLNDLSRLGDEEVMSTLTSLKGIGPWTAGIYLLMVLRRPNIWPRGDRALLVSMMEVKGLDDVPNDELALEIAENWRPWQAVAARILWHNYLCERGRR